MPHSSATLLSHRSVIRIGGADRVSFLQGLVSNDVAKTAGGGMIHAALLTPQGKFLHDMFVREQGDAFLIDCEANRAADLLRRLAAYKLRAKVTFEDLAEAFDIWALWPAENNFDPRLPALGARLILEKGKQPVDMIPVPFAAYDEHRLRLGIADGSRDLEIEKSTLAEGNFDYLNSVDWKKGCYVGQELTARMYYRGLAKRRLFPVLIEGAAPPHGAILGQDAGEMRSSSGAFGLALLKIEAAQQAIDQKTPLSHGETKIWPQIPAWMKIDAAPANR